MANDEGRRRLAEAVRTRRAQLGYAQEDLVQYGGPGDLTIRKIERGYEIKYRERTIHQLETALKWRPGTVRALLANEASHNPDDWIANHIAAGTAIIIEPGTPAADRLQAVVAAARAVFNLPSSPAIDEAKRAMTDAIIEATQTVQNVHPDTNHQTGH